MEHQLVVQFPCATQADFDAVVELEERIAEAVVGLSAEVDGHDSGSSEANIFILTTNVYEAFERVQQVVKGSPEIATGMRAAFRRVNGTEYTMLWPPGAGSFAIA